MSLSYLHAATFALTTKEARQEWNIAAKQAIKDGHQNLVETFQPDFEKDRVKKIDTQLCKLFISLGFSKKQVDDWGYGCSYQWERAKNYLIKEKIS